MSIESFSGAATVAAACTIFFVLVAKSWQFISRSVQSGPAFAGSIMREAAQRFRDEFERLSHTQAIYLSSSLVFVVLFFAANALQAERLYAGYPDWQLHLFLVVLMAGVILVIARMIHTIVTRQNVRLLRDANIAIGHQLQRISSDTEHVFHDVETSAGVIDHVVIGKSGAYAVNVFARRPARNGCVELENGKLNFAPSGHAQSIVTTGKCIAALEREFRRLVDHRVRVQSVIAVPGWEVNRQAVEEHLLVNDRNLRMLLRRWKNEADSLMDDDVEALQQMLADLTSA